MHFGVLEAWRIIMLIVWTRLFIEWYWPSAYQLSLFICKKENIVSGEILCIHKFVVKDMKFVVCLKLYTKCASH